MLDEEPRGRGWRKATLETDLKTKAQQRDHGGFNHIGTNESKSISQ